MSGYLVPSGEYARPVVELQAGGTVGGLVALRITSVASADDAEPCVDIYALPHGAAAELAQLLLEAQRIVSARQS